jgi:acetyl esterase/lipase
MSSQDSTKLILNYHPNFEYNSQAPRAPSLDFELSNFLQSHPQLQLGGSDPFWTERRHHQQIFGIHNLPENKIHPIKHIQHTAIPGPHGTIPLRIITPSSTSDKDGEARTGALLYFHGGGYTVGSVDEFENGLRLLAEESSCQIWAVEYRLAPEHSFPVQLDEYDAVIDHLQSGSVKDIDPDRVAGGGDSAGGNMTAAISLRRLDQGKKPLVAQVLLYPEARMPFDTPAATENNSGYYLQCNGIFGFANNYLPRPSGEFLGTGM